MALKPEETGFIKPKYDSYSKSKAVSRKLLIRCLSTYFGKKKKFFWFLHISIRNVIYIWFWFSHFLCKNYINHQFFQSKHTVDFVTKFMSFKNVSATFTEALLVVGCCKILLLILAHNLLQTKLTYWNYLLLQF